MIADNSATLALYPHGQKTLGYILYDPVSKKVIEEHNSQQLFIPASSLKVVTSVVAWLILGPDYRFMTQLSYRGAIQAGQLKGDLILQGGGDPLLRVSDLLVMVDRLQRAGIQSVTGRIYYDDSLVPASELIDDKMDIDASYNPGISALSLEDNNVVVRWEANKDRTAFEEMFMQPDLPHIQFVPLAKKKTSSVYMQYSAEDGLERWDLVFPEISQTKKTRRRSSSRISSGRRRLPVKKPALLTAYTLQKLLLSNGMHIGQQQVLPVVGQQPPVIAEHHIYTHRSRSLEELIRTTLQYSNNLMAELIYLVTAQNLSGQRLGLLASGQAYGEYLQQQLPRISWQGLSIVNGSGLSGQNRISPEQLAAVMVLGDEHPAIKQSFFTLMPIMGWNWPHNNRFAEPESAMYVYAKTGSIHYGISLSGYITTQQNKRLVFVLLSSENESRDILDGLAKKTKGNNVSNWQGVLWGRQSRKAIDEIVKLWIAKY